MPPVATTTSSRPPLTAARTLQQPGAPAALRIDSRHMARGRHLRLQLLPGHNLFDAVVQPLAALGIRHAAIALLGGWLDRAQYCVSVPDTAGLALLTHSAPITTGPVCLASANATLAQGLDGQPLLHCHAALYATGGAMRGGHLLMQHCWVGGDLGGDAGAAITARVTPFDGFVLRAAFDDETQLPLVQPFDLP